MKYLLTVGEATNVGYDKEMQVFDSLDDAKQEFNAAVDSHVQSIIDEANMNDDEIALYKAQVEDSAGCRFNCIDYREDTEGEWFVSIDEVSD